VVRHRRRLSVGPRRGRRDEHAVHAIAVHVDDLEAVARVVEELAGLRNTAEREHDEAAERVVVPAVVFAEQVGLEFLLELIDLEGYLTYLC
jgi:hypothetical protein